MYSDTLTYLATDSTMQQIAVIVQGVMLVIGAIMTLFGKKR